jgi:hypothetical protein
MLKVSRWARSHALTRTRRRRLCGYVVEEDVLDNHAFPTLNPISDPSLRLEQFLQFGRQVEDATLEILRRAGVEPDLTQL